MLKGPPSSKPDLFESALCWERGLCHKPRPPNDRNHKSGFCFFSWCGRAGKRAARAMVDLVSCSSSQTNSFPQGVSTSEDSPYHLPYSQEETPQFDTQEDTTCDVWSKSRPQGGLVPRPEPKERKGLATFCKRKTRQQERAVCAFCLYDNSVFS